METSVDTIHADNWKHLCQKQVPRVGMSNYTTQILWGAITYSRRRYLLLAHKSATVIVHHWHYTDVKWPSWHFKLFPSRLFIQDIVQAHNEESSKLLVTGPSWGDSATDQWIPHPTPHPCHEATKANYAEIVSVPLHDHESMKADPQTRNESN